MLDGRDPYPPPDFDPTAAPNFIWPPAVAYLLAPLTLLPLGAADVVMRSSGSSCFAAALWLVGLRDWRVYGVLALWPQVAGEMRVSHLTPAPLPPRRARLALPRHAVRARARGRGSRGAQVLRLAARGVARRQASRRRRRCSRSASRRLPASCPPRSRRSTTTSASLLQLGRGIRPGRVHALRAARAGGRLRDGRPDRHVRSRAALLVAHVALPKLHARRRGRARPSRRSSGSTTSRSRRAARDRPTAALAGLVPPARHLGPRRSGDRHRRRGRTSRRCCSSSSIVFGVAFTERAAAAGHAATLHLAW